MTARLVTHVHVDGAVFGPDDDVPPDVAAKITNPKAWVGGEVPESAEPAGPVESPSDDVPEPPRSGPGSTKAAWLEYAAARGWVVTDGMSRDDIIALAPPGGEG